MSDNTISIDPDKAARSVKLIAHGQEAAGNLDVRGRGVGQGPASGFRHMLTSWVFDAQQALTEIEQQLGKLQANVTETVVELGERDAALAAEAATFQAGVADIPAPSDSPAPSGSEPKGSQPTTTEPTANPEGTAPKTSGPLIK